MRNDGAGYTSIERTVDLVLFNDGASDDGAEILHFSYFHFEDGEAAERECYVTVTNGTLVGTQNHKKFGTKQLTVPEAQALIDLLTVYVYGR